VLGDGGQGIINIIPQQNLTFFSSFSADSNVLHLSSGGLLGHRDEAALVAVSALAVANHAAILCIHTLSHTHTLFLLRIPLSIEEKVDDSMQNKDDSVSLCDSIDPLNVYVALAVDALRTDLYV
jgi:hypothetical protein